MADHDQHSGRPVLELAHQRRHRIELAADLVGGEGLAALVVTSPANIRYLTGFTGSAGIVLLDDTGVITLVTDSRYRERAASECDPVVSIEIASGGAQIGLLAQLCDHLHEVGLEADHVTWSRQRLIADVFGHSGIELRATTGLIEQLRLVKDDAEIERIEAAAAITDQALSEVVPLLTSGATEREVRHAMEQRMVDLGADGPAFATIVASGPNASRPHHEAGDRAIQVGDLVVIDCGAMVDGYRSDMTRTFVIGQPDPEAAAMLDLVTRAQAAGVAVAAPGRTGDDIDAACRAVIDDGGCGDEFTHGAGHGVGLDIHEVPFLLGSHVPLEIGQVVTVEPGVYRSGLGGVRVEDTVVVTADGCRALTRSPKAPILV